MTDYEIVLTYTLLASLTEGKKTETYTISVMNSTGISTILSRGYFSVPLEGGAFKIVPFSSVASATCTKIVTA